MSERDIRYQYRDDPNEEPFDIDEYNRRELEKAIKREQELREEWRRKRAEGNRQRALAEKKETEEKNNQLVSGIENNEVNENENCKSAFEYNENDYYKWDIVYFLLILSETIVFSFLAFNVDKKSVVSSIFIHIIISLVVSSCVYGLINLLSNYTGYKVCKSTKSVHRFRLLFLICIVLIIVTSVILSQFVLSYIVQYEDKEYYEQKETVCYITNTGDCYHREDCGYLHSKIKTTVSSAKAKGYSPCTYCWTDYTTQTRLVTKERIEHHYILSYIISLVFWIGISALIIVIHKKRIQKTQATPE